MRDWEACRESLVAEYEKSEILSGIEKESQNKDTRESLVKFSAQKNSSNFRRGGHALENFCYLMLF